MTFSIPSQVVEQVAEHALAVHLERQGFESLGVLVVGDGRRVVRYTKVANAAGRPERARFASESQLRRPGGLPLVVTHSHPVGDASPSDLDLRWALHLGLDVFAIFSLASGELRAWRLDGGGFAEVELEIEILSPHRRVRPWREVNTTRAGATPVSRRTLSTGASEGYRPIVRPDASTAPRSPDESDTFRRPTGARRCSRRRPVGFVPRRTR